MLGKDGLHQFDHLQNQEIQNFIKTVDELTPVASDDQNRSLLGALCFFEASTRTRVSFEAAGLQLGYQFVNLGSSDLSLKKGESLEDTFRVLREYDFDFFVVRHSEDGVMKRIQEIVGRPVFNAGEGVSSHPTQALGDLLTLEENGSDSSRRILFYGDIQKSRVARSAISLFKRFSISVSLADDGSDELKDLADKLGCHRVSPDASPEFDFVYVLRLQTERGSQARLPAFRKAGLGPNSKWLHAGPVIVGQDIHPELADFKSSSSLVLQQVKNCFRVRKKLLSALQCVQF